jgi:hypothetical protein
VGFVFLLFDSLKSGYIYGSQPSPYGRRRPGSIRQGQHETVEAAHNLTSWRVASSVSIEAFEHLDLLGRTDSESAED